MVQNEAALETEITVEDLGPPQLCSLGFIQRARLKLLEEQRMC